MGLDMYLTRHVYIGAKYKHRNVTGIIDIKIGDNPVQVNFNKVSYIVETAGYWRKANAIHSWIVANVQDGEDNCASYYFDTEKMQELLDICNKILAEVRLVDGKVSNGKRMEGGEWVDIWEDGKIINNPNICHELLPTQSGFFFGGTDYDEYYYQDIQDTKNILEECLNDPDGEYYYQSSW